MRSLKTHCKLLEASCHGVAWLSIWLAFIWTINNAKFHEMQINMLIGLIIDILIVALIKAACRRRRPMKNTEFFSIGPDKFSFPSGHASRACYITMFFMYLYPLPKLFWGPLLAWMSSVAVSRLLLQRHYLLDVLVGLLLGAVECYLLNFIWLNSYLTSVVMQWISSDYVHGGEAD